MYMYSKLFLCVNILRKKCNGELMLIISDCQQLTFLDRI